MEEDYRGSHRAPTREDDVNSAMYEMDKTYPSDIYSRDGLRLYGGGRGQTYDKESYAVIMRVRGKPDAPVVIYRAVPKNATNINEGDWVTPSLTYARQHNLSNLDGKGKVLKKTVTAKELFTDGDSINEFGYSPIGEE